MNFFSVIFHVNLLVYFKIVESANSYPEISVKKLANYPDEKSIISALNQTVVIILDSNKQLQSQVYLTTHRNNEEIDNITNHFSGHVFEFVVQPQKMMGVFLQKDMKHLVVLKENNNLNVLKEFNLHFVPTTVSFPENNDNGNIFIIFDEPNRNLYFTQSCGNKFKFLADKVVSFKWQNYDGNSILLVERRMSYDDSLSSLQYINVTSLLNIQKDIKLTTLVNHVQQFSVDNQFLLVRRPNSTLLYFKNHKFTPTLFYPKFHIQNIYLIDTTNYLIKVIAANDQESRFYIGSYYNNTKTIKFVLSLINVEKEYLRKINSADGVYIATQKNVSTSVITNDNGVNWNEIDINVGNNSVFSSKLLPNIVVMSTYSDITISKDGGISWNEYRTHNYSYYINEITGVIIGIKLNSPTKKFKYSKDYGLTWDNLTIYENSLKNHMLYSYQKYLQFYILAWDSKESYLTLVDFTHIFSKPCDESDYNYVKSNVCIFGRKITYKRRKNRECYPEVEKSEPGEICECDFKDFDCEENFVRLNFSAACVPDKKINPKMLQYMSCRPGELYRKSEGYRKLEINVCTEKYESKFLSNLEVCPYEKEDYLITESDHEMKLYNENNNEVKYLKAVTSNSQPYDFDLLSGSLFQSYDKVVYRHGPNKKVAVKSIINETKQIYNLNYDWISGWLFYIIKDPFTIKAVPISLKKKSKAIVTLYDKFEHVTSMAIHVLDRILYWRNGNLVQYGLIDYNNDDIIKVSDIKTILTKYSVRSDLLIDYLDNLLYFYTTTDGTVKTCDLFGEKCNTFLKLHYSSSLKLAISINYFYWYNPHIKSIQFISRSKEFTHTANAGTNLTYNLQNLYDMKFVSKSIQLFTKCLAQHTSSAICFKIINSTKSIKINENSILVETVCPQTKYCDGLFDCFYGEDEEYCIKDQKNQKQETHHKFSGWIGIFIASLVVMTFILMYTIYKRKVIKLLPVRYNTLENRVLIESDILDDDESDIEMLFN